MMLHARKNRLFRAPRNRQKRCFSKFAEGEKMGIAISLVPALEGRGPLKETCVYLCVRV